MATDYLKLDVVDAYKDFLKAKPAPPAFFAVFNDGNLLATGYGLSPCMFSSDFLHFVPITRREHAAILLAFPTLDDKRSALLDELR